VEVLGFVAAALVLSFERLFYLWAWHQSDSFRRFSAHPLVAWLGADPPLVLERFFYAFKVIQISVFLEWCLAHGQGAFLPAQAGVLQLGVGATLLGVGQALNFGVFLRLGALGVFYGNRFGYTLPHCDGLPFSLCKHPQYLGTVLSIWGFFLITRFPHDDWMLIPALETLYYALGAHFES
jgi:phosphatidyl-N-methylethanolamine N-methyltransferase